jgi:hypothetical protein
VRSSAAVKYSSILSKLCEKYCRRFKGKRKRYLTVDCPFSFDVGGAQTVLSWIKLTCTVRKEQNQKLYSEKRADLLDCYVVPITDIHRLGKEDFINVRRRISVKKEFL